MTTATIRIRHAPKDGRKRTLVIDLKSPNRTTLRNKTEKDRSFVTGLLERWGLLEPLFMPDPVVEDN